MPWGFTPTYMLLMHLFAKGAPRRRTPKETAIIEISVANVPNPDHNP
jgi:hypothetical protein